MTVKMILAVDKSNAIGWSDGRLPWKISEDMKRFKALTTGHDIIMGRKTFASFNRPEGLPNRFNIVVSSNLDGYHDDVCVVNDFKNMVLAHQDHSDGCGGYFPEQKDLWIIGGATIYNQAIEEQLVDEIYLTLVDVESNADVQLTFDLTNWKLFVLRQAQNGVQWNLQQIQWVRTEAGIPITFLTLKKTK